MHLQHTNPDAVALDPKQLAAVTAPVGPVLVLAGPGAGKTLVLTERIRYLANVCRVPPDRILALTFTNKAAEEMSSRLERTLPGPTRPLMGTFHKFCIGVLRAHHRRAGLSPRFTVADEELQRIVLHRALPKLSREEGSVTNALRHLQRMQRIVWKNPDAPHSPGERRLLRSYKAELRANHLVDFDDLIFLTHDLLENFPHVLEAYRDRFRHILVDEFQDTDRVQYALICRLAQGHRSIFVVADDEQCIYAWRNADRENIRRFEEAFLQGGAPILLDQNYRTTREILHLARRLLAKNEVRYERELNPRRHGADVLRLTFETPRDEGRHLAADIRTRVAQSPDLSYRDIAVLYPQHTVGRDLEHSFMEAEIPCHVSRKQGFFEQPEVGRTLSMLRYALNRGNDASLERFLRQELDGADPTLYPAIRSLQERDGLRSFKQAAFRYLKEASEEEKEVERALGLAGTVASGVGRGGEAPLGDLVNDILDQLNTSSAMSIKNSVDRIEDPLLLPGLDGAIARILPVCRSGGTLYVAARDEVLRYTLTQILRRALARPGLTVLGPPPFSRLEIDENAGVLAFDKEPPAAGDRFVHIGRVVEQAGIGPALAALKLCQAIVRADVPPYLPDYVAFDIETTDLDLDRAEIIEIGAVRVRGGREVAAFQSLVRPAGAISPAASAVHGIEAAQLSRTPSLQEVYPELRAFAGNDLLVAHNGFRFDFQVLHREARRKRLPRIPNATLDTLPVARSYFPGAPNGLDALRERYGIQTPEARHRALDDARVLHRVFEGLKRERASRARRTAHEGLLDRVALCMLFQERPGDHNRLTEEEDLHFNLGAQRLLAPDNGCLKSLIQRFPRLSLHRLKDRVHAWLQEDPGPDLLASRAPELLQRFREMAEAFDAAPGPLQEKIERFLDFADLYRFEDETPNRNAVSLLTLHAAKGLEFREVYICGLEDGLLPNRRAVKSGDRGEMEEQRRLLYVGMTRAKDRLTITRVRRRAHGTLAPSRFWQEIGAELATMEQISQGAS